MKKLSKLNKKFLNKKIVIHGQTGTWTVVHVYLAAGCIPVAICEKEDDRKIYRTSQNIGSAHNESFHLVD